MANAPTPRKKPEKLSDWNKIEDRIHTQSILESLHYIESNWKGEDQGKQKKDFYNSYFNQKRIHRYVKLTEEERARVEKEISGLLTQLNAWKEILGEGVQKQELKTLISSLAGGMESLDNQFKKVNEFLTKYPSPNPILSGHVTNWKNINDASGTTIGFRSAQDVKIEEDPETFLQMKTSGDSYRFDPSSPYSENCRRKIYFLKEELKISSNEDLVLQRMHACSNLSEAWNRPLDLPTSTKFEEDMKKITGFKAFLEEIRNYLITVKFYQVGGAVVPQQFYLLLGPPGVGKSYISMLIARALNKQFININCASAKLSELIGIAQDYTGKDFGKVVKRMIEGKDRAPVILFDEIDKCSDKEILNTISIIFDDTKNKTDFEDVYFQFPVPMNECFMICTANYLERLEQFVLSRCTRVKIEWLTYADRIGVAKMELLSQLKESKSGIDKYADSTHPEYKFTDKFFHRTLVEEWGVRGIKNNIKSMTKRLISKCVKETATRAEFKESELEKLCNASGKLDDYDWKFRYYREWGQRDDTSGRRVNTCRAGDYANTKKNVDEWIKNWKDDWVKDWKSKPGNTGDPTSIPEPPKEKIPKLHINKCECFMPSRVEGWIQNFRIYKNDWKDTSDDGSWKWDEYDPIKDDNVYNVADPLNP